jgi:carboxyl-terminal processing protease
MTIGFPDVCNTPAGPVTVPIPYPNIGTNAMAAPFSPNVLVTMMPALNMGSVIPMTSGDEAGVAHPMIKGPARFTMGNPIVKVNFLPGINLTCPTTGNNMNNALGAVLVPSVTNVFFTLASPTPAGLDPLDRSALDAIAGALDRPAVEARLLEPGVGLVRLTVFAFETPALVGRAIEELSAASGGLSALIFDLRENPGGDLAAAADLASDFLPAGAVLYRAVDADGDELPVRARRGLLHATPLVLLVSGATASAAEIFAGALRHHSRAILVGRRTFGKASAQRVLPREDAPGALYATVASVRLPDGANIHGAGLEPDIPLVAPEEAERPGAPDLKTLAARLRGHGHRRGAARLARAIRAAWG